VNFRRDQTYPERHGCILARRRLELEGKESMEKVVGQKSEQQKALDESR
jgi:hypothetical protein